MKGRLAGFVIFGIVLGGAAFGTITVRSDRPSPAGQLLRAIARGEVNTGAVVVSIARCHDWAAQHGCGAGLEAVLSEFSQAGDRQKQTVLEALSVAVQEADPAMGESLYRLQTQVRQGNRLGPLISRKPWLESASREGLPPTREDIGRIAGPVFDARLFAYVETLLPQNADALVTKALEAAIAESCETIYEGRAVKTCSELGLWNIQRASLWVSVRDLRGSRGDPRVVQRYLSIDGHVLEAALNKGEVSNDTALATHMRLIRGWKLKQPTRWDAWADIEELLGAR